LIALAGGLYKLLNKAEEHLRGIFLKETGYHIKRPTSFSPALIYTKGLYKNR